MKPARPKFPASLLVANVAGAFSLMMWRALSAGFWSVAIILGIVSALAVFYSIRVYDREMEYAELCAKRHLLMQEPGAIRAIKAELESDL